MSSKRRLRRNECKGKEAFVTKEIASMVARKINQRNNLEINPLSSYLCNICQKYHIGKTFNQLEIFRGKEENKFS